MNEVEKAKNLLNDRNCYTCIFFNNPLKKLGLACLRHEKYRVNLPEDLICPQWQNHNKVSIPKIHRHLKSGRIITRDDINKLIEILEEE